MAKAPEVEPEQAELTEPPMTLAMYHGTSRTFALAMAGSITSGTIDVTRGRGEFGRGFYAQDSPGNAFRRGQLLYGNNAAILVLEVESHAFFGLAIQKLSLSQARQLYATVCGNNSQHIYTTMHDVISGPLVNAPKITQMKFQTASSQMLLNGQLTQRSVRP